LKYDSLQAGYQNAQIYFRESCFDECLLICIIDINAAPMFIDRLVLRLVFQLSAVSGFTHFHYHLQHNRGCVGDKWLLSTLLIETGLLTYAIVTGTFRIYPLMPCSIL
jgi:hypothetical protein